MLERQEAAEGQEEKMYLNHAHAWTHGDGNGINVYIFRSA